MNPQHLYFLQAIVEQGSMAKAAERLRVTQPTLSRIVKTLEEQAGAPLLHRERYGVEPTELGASLARQGRQISQQISQAGEIVGHWKRGLTGEIKLGVGPMLAMSVMGDFFTKAFYQDWPYAIQVNTGFAASLIDALTNEEIDAAIIPAKLNLRSKQLVQYPLFPDRVSVYGSHTHPLNRSQAPASPIDFQGHSWIETGFISGLFKSTPEMLTDVGIEYQTPRLKFSGDLLMAMNVVSNSDALCILPEALVSMFKFPTGLTRIETTFQLPKRDVAFWTTQKMADRPQILHFRERLSEFLKEAMSTRSNAMPTQPT